MRFQRIMSDSDMAGRFRPFPPSSGAVELPFAWMDRKQVADIGNPIWAFQYGGAVAGAC